jgi:hypothetical protein
MYLQPATFTRYGKTQSVARMESLLKRDSEISETMGQVSLQSVTTVFVKLHSTNWQTAGKGSA